MTKRVATPGHRKRYALRRKLYFGRNLMKPAPESGAEKRSSETDAKAKEAEQEIAQMREMVLRQRAEFDNFRKRTQREKEQARDAAAENLLSRILPVVDNLDRALSSSATATDAKSVREGVTMILNQFNRALEAEGLVKISPMQQEFDPTRHDAIATEERTDVADNHVCDVLLPGYTYKDKLVRAAMVKVAKAPKGEKISPGE